MSRSAWVREFEGYAGKSLLAERTPGASAGFAVEGRPTYLAQFGYRDRELGLPVTSETVFPIASVTKSFTSVAIMQLVEQGKLSVNDPVVKFLPEFRTPNPEQTGRITIHHLLTHTSGLPVLSTADTTIRDDMLVDPWVKQLPYYEAIQSMKSTYSPEEFMAHMGEEEYELLGAPGTRFNYCNEGYILLGIVIERISGQDWGQYLQERILEPAGMARTTMSLERVMNWEEVSQLYAELPGGEIIAAPGFWRPSFSAAGADGTLLISCVPDLLRYLEIFRTGGKVEGVQILRPESVKAMTSPHAPLGPGEAYGYGLMVTRDHHGATVIQHGGTFKGAKANIFCLPEQGFTGVILTNIDTAPATKLSYGAFNAYLGLPVDTPVVNLQESEVSRAELEQYTGEYPGGGGPPLTFGVGEMGLEARFGPEEVYPLRYVRPDLFLMKFAGTDETIHFIRDSIGEIDAVFFHLRTIVRKRS